MAGALWWKLRVAFACIGILVGVSVFFCFATAYHNWDTAVWGLLSGIFAGMALYLHIQYKLDMWMTRPHRLRHWMIFSCIVQLLGVCGLAAYLFIAINEHQKLTPYGPEAYYLTSVWCFMVLKWGIAMFFFGRDYQFRYREQVGHAATNGKYFAI